MAPRKQPRADDLDRLESLVSEFVGTSKTMLEADHRKIDIVYDFLFLGQPQADPPVPPFVSMVQSSLTSHKNQLNTINSIAGKLIWSLVGLLVGGVGWFIGSTLLHIIGWK